MYRNLIIPIALAVIITLSGQELMESQKSCELNMLNKEACIVGIKDLFDVDISKDKIETSKGIIKIEDNIDMDFDISIKDDESDGVWRDLEAEGKFTLNGHECLFKAEGRSEVYELKTGETVYTGLLDGMVSVEGVIRDLDLGFEKMQNRNYLSFNIGNSGEKNGSTILFFGSPVITESICNEIDELVDEEDRKFDLGDLVHKVKYKIDNVF